MTRPERSADRNELSAFVLELFPHAAIDTYVSLRCFRDDVDGVWGYDQWRTVRLTGNPDDLIDAAEDLATLAAIADEPACFAPPICTFRTKEKADEGNVASGLVITAELDSNPTVGRQQLENILGAATVVMASGGVWTDPETGELEDKLHLHWRLAKPTQSKPEHDLLKEANRLIATLVKADASAVPLVHPLRWPGSWHRKREARIASIIKLNPNVEITLADGLNKLRAAAADKAKGNGHDKDPPRSFAGPAKPADLYDLTAAIACIPNNDAPWEDWNNVGLRLYAATGGSEVGLVLFKEWSRASAKFDTDTTAKRWNHYRKSPPDRTNVGALYNLAREHNPNFVRPSLTRKQVAVARSAAAFDEQAPPAPEQPPQPGLSRPPADEWPEPKDLLGDFSEPMPTFPGNFFPPAMEQFCADIADRIQCPIDYPAIPLLIAAATVIGRQFRMAPKAKDRSWTERPCLWGGIIGPVGGGKTPAMSAALAPLWKLRAQLFEKDQPALDAHKAKVRTAKLADAAWQSAYRSAIKKNKPLPERPADADPGSPPTTRQFVTTDTTQERLAQLIADDPRGVMLFRDELSGWFQSFNQYRPGADEQFYLQCHAGGPWLQNRVGGDIIIPDIYLNIFDGFQPKIIKDILAGKSKSCANGMTARFSLLVWPDTAKDFSFIDSASTPNNRANVDTIFKRLAEYDPEQFVGPKTEQSYLPFRFDDAGYDIFREWYVRISLLIRSNEDHEDPYFDHLSKYPGLFARLALVHHLLRYAAGGPSKPDPATVDAETATAVRDLIDDYLTPHARKIYGRLNRSSGYAGAVKIARWVVTDKTFKTPKPPTDKTAN